jgi:hypothetical protein
MCWGDGDLPAFLELADGNQSDAQAQTQLDRLHRQEFACEADALAAVESLAAQCSPPRHPEWGSAGCQSD